MPNSRTRQQNESFSTLSAETDLGDDNHGPSQKRGVSWLTLNKSKSRSIEVDRQAYRWAFSDVGDAYTVTVQSASGVGQKLALVLPLHEEHPSSVTPAFVAQMIKFGIEAGWTPWLSGPEVRLAYAQERFTRFA